METNGISICLNIFSFSYVIDDILNAETFGEIGDATSGLPSFFQCQGTTVLDELVAEFDVEDYLQEDNRNMDTFGDMEEYTVDELLPDFLNSTFYDGILSSG